MRPVTGVVTLFVGTALLWIFCALLSQWTQTSGMKPPVAKTDKLPATISSSLQQLEKDAAAQPTNTELQLQFASALAKEGAEKESSEIVMRAVQVLLAVVDREPTNETALLNLASITFESGVIDKAEEFYRRYLVLQPKDNRARVDYALTLLQLGDPDRAEIELRTVLKAEPKSFPASLTLALVLKMKGKLEEAKSVAVAAKKIAPDENGMAVVDKFISDLAITASAPSMPQVPAVAMPSAGTSPAIALQQFVENHPILGPKLRGVSWPDAKTAVVALENFPVDQMPPMAKEKLTSRMKELGKLFDSPVTIALVDADSKRELLKFEVGGK